MEALRFRVKSMKAQLDEQVFSVRITFSAPHFERPHCMRKRLPLSNKIEKSCWRRSAFEGSTIPPRLKTC